MHSMNTRWCVTSRTMTHHRVQRYEEYMRHQSFWGNLLFFHLFHELKPYKQLQLFRSKPSVNPVFLDWDFVRTFARYFKFYRVWHTWQSNSSVRSMRTGSRVDSVSSSIVRIPGLQKAVSIIGSPNWRQNPFRQPVGVSSQWRCLVNQQFTQQGIHQARLCVK